MLVGIELGVAGGLAHGEEILGPLGVVPEDLGLLVVKLLQNLDPKLVGGSAGGPLEGEVQAVGKGLGILRPVRRGDCDIAL